MTDADRDRMTTLIALVVIGVPLGEAIVMKAENAEALLAAWRSVNQQAAN